VKAAPPVTPTTNSVRSMQDRLLGDRVFAPKDLTDRRPLRVISPVEGYGRLELLMEVRSQRGHFRPPLLSL